MMDCCLLSLSVSLQLVRYGELRVWYSCVLGLQPQPTYIKNHKKLEQLLILFLYLPGSENKECSK